MYSLFYFQENIIRSKLLLRLNYKNISHMPKPGYIQLNLPLKSIKKVTDPKIVVGLNLLTLISGSKSFIKDLDSSKRRTGFLINISTTLRKQNLMNILGLYSFFLFPNLDKRYLSPSIALATPSSYSLWLKDLSIIPGILQNFFNWIGGIQFNLNFTTEDQLGNSLWLNIFFNKENSRKKKK